MDGQFYVDQRMPFLVTSGGTITLTATLQALLPVGSLPVLGQNYFSYVGKAVRIRAIGQMTTGATPGNINFQYMFGSGVSNVGTNVCGVTLTGTVNQTTVSWVADTIFRCRSCGVSGSLFSMGTWIIQNVGSVLMLPTAPAAITVDTTQNSFLSLQCSRSGSTGESIQVHDMIFEALN